MRFLKINIFGLAVLGLVALGVRAEATQDKALSKFVKADVAYEKADYAEAISLYHEILSEGSTSGALLYNLGNSYLKAGKLGEAILYYKRAEAFIPRDSDLRSNLDYARSLVRGDRSFKQVFLKRFLVNFTRFYSPQEFLMLMCGSFLFLGGFHIGSLYLRWNTKRRRFVIVALAVLSLIYACGFFVKENMEKNNAVVLDPTEAKFGPTISATTHFELPEGEQVRILKSDALWIKIRRPNGRVGWAEKKYIERI